MAMLLSLLFKTIGARKQRHSQPFVSAPILQRAAVNAVIVATIIFIARVFPAAVILEIRLFRNRYNLQRLRVLFQFQQRMFILR